MIIISQSISNFPHTTAERLRAIQSRLMDLCSHVATPLSSSKEKQIARAHFDGRRCDCSCDVHLFRFFLSCCIAPQVEGLLL
jgi:hypothetical protein